MFEFVFVKVRGEKGKRKDPRRLQTVKLVASKDRCGGRAGPDLFKKIKID